MLQDVRSSITTMRELHIKQVWGLTRVAAMVTSILSSKLT